MATIEIYVKDTSNVRGGMPLTSFEVVPPEWQGESLMLPFGEQRERRKVEGWTDLITANPYPDVVRGCPTTIHVVRARSGGDVGYLVYGGNSGVRIGGRNGWGRPILWVEDENDLPATVREALNH